MTLEPNHRLNAGELEALIQLIFDGLELKFIPDATEATLRGAQVKLLIQRQLLR